MELHRCLAVALVVSAGGPAWALDPGQSLDQQVLDVWRIEQGLPQETVNAIAQTPDGYLWLGTKGGMARFDGSKFTTFGLNELRTWSIRALTVDHAGTLWIGTGGSLGTLIRYRNGSFDRFRRGDATQVTAMPVFQSHPADEVLFASARGRVHRVAAGRYTTLDLNAGVPTPLHALLRDRRGRVWVGTDAGLMQEHEGRLIHAAELTGTGAVRALLEDRGGRLWVATDGGLQALDGGRTLRYSVAEGLPANQVHALEEDRDGNLWVGTSAGLARVRDGIVSRSRVEKSLLAAAITALAEDREGSLWIGMRGEGLGRLKDRPFVSVGVREGLADDRIRSVYAARDGSLWVGTSAGLDRYKGSPAGLSRSPSPPLDFPATAITEDRDGRIWAGGAQGRLSRLSTQAWMELRDKRRGRFAVGVLLGARQGGLWIGTDGGGLFRHQDGTTTAVVGVSGQSAGDRITALYESPRGELWIGTSKNLFCLHNGVLETYGPAGGLAGGVLTLHGGSDGRIWVGRSMRGLCWVSRGGLRCYSVAQGLGSNAIHSIVDDQQGHLWAGAARGILRINTAKLGDLGNPATNHVIEGLFGTTDGLRSTSFDIDGTPRAVRTSDGHLWFGSSRGLAVVDPARVRPNTVVPPVFVEELLVDRQPRAHAQPVELAPGTRDVEVRYNGISLLAPERVTFRYRLDGHDQTWIEAQGRRQAFYTNLPPGGYRFQVMAANSDGVWNTASASFAFTVLPHFYQRGVFFVVMTAALALAVYLGHAWRVRRLQREASLVIDERARVARELHDTLLQNLTGVAMQLKGTVPALTGAPAGAVAFVRSCIDQLDKGAAEARRSILGLRGSDAEPYGLARAVDASIARLTRGTPIRGRLDVAGPAPAIPVEVERQLLRIAEEAVANAVRHAEPAGVFVEISHANGDVILRVRDDGRGFTASQPPATDGNHFGLAGMNERARSIGARLNLRSAPGAGTEVEVFWSAAGAS